jgi:hypothetical protein
VATIIDALVVQLELDTSDYKRSWKDAEDIEGAAAAKRDKVNKKNDKEEKERARVEKQNALDRKKHTDEFTGSITTLGKALAATFLGFEGASGFMNFLAGLNTSQAELGRNSTKIGVSAKAMNDYGKAVELAGGKASDATETFAKLAHEKSAKDMKGDIGPLLQLLQQKGVAYEDANGKLLDMGKIFDDLSKKTQNMKDEDRHFLFAQAGIAEGVINRMLEEVKLQDDQLQKARQMNAVTDESTKKAEELKTALEGVAQARDRVGNAILETVSAPTKGFLDRVTELLGGPAQSAQSKRDQWGGASADDRMRANREKYGNLALDEARARAAGGVPLAPGSRAARNNNPGNIKAVGGQASDAQGFRIFATLAEGQAAMRANLERKIQQGDDTIAKLITKYEGTDAQKDPSATAAYIERVSKLTGKGMGDKITAADLQKVIDAMTVVEGGLPNAAMRGPPSGATPGVGSNTNNSSTASTNNTTTVTAPITINPPAGADPTAIANLTASALTRKIAVAQANTGQQ